jgi:Domain of unknown function (DUF4359)
MLWWRVPLIGVVALLGLGGIMILTNPQSDAYGVYAIEQIANRARDECNKVPAGFGVVLQGPCRAAIDAAKPQIRPLLNAATTRQNFVFFSIYRTDLSVPSLNFHTQVETIGVFNNFYTYKMP